MPATNLQATFYALLERFINAYKNQDCAALAEYGLAGTVLQEVNESLSFLANRQKIHLPPLADLGKPIDGEPWLSLDEVDGDYLAECLVFDGTGQSFYLVGEFTQSKNGQWQFEFQQFDV